MVKVRYDVVSFTSTSIEYLGITMITYSNKGQDT